MVAGAQVTFIDEPRTGGRAVAGRLVSHEQGRTRGTYAVSLSPSHTVRSSGRSSPNGPLSAHWRVPTIDASPSRNQPAVPTFGLEAETRSPR